MPKMAHASSSIWEDFEKAKKLSEIDQGTDGPEDACMMLLNDEDGMVEDVCWNRRHEGAIFSELEDGDFHVCFGVNCKHATMDASKHIWCTLTGVCVGFHAERDQDASWTGRSTTSANPDDTAGTPQGGWLKRRDMYQASVDAHRMATRLTDEESVYTPREKDAKTMPVVKRGALCVDEVKMEDPNKRHRASKRNGNDSTRDAMKKLQSEALSVIEKLVNVDHCHATTTTHAKTAEAAEEATEPFTNRSRFLDPRLQNVDFVRNAAFSKFIKDAREGDRPFNMSTLHDICVRANEFVKEQRSLQTERNKRALSVQMKAQSNDTQNSTASFPLLLKRFDGQTLRCCADLIVNVWNAVCSTPYMRDSRKGNDSFRPFAAGILYGFKRGTYLQDGTCIVPELPMIAAQLPQLRSQQASTAAKQLQSSSHRGLCSLHRSIASLADETEESTREETREKFRIAAAGAAMLRALCLRAGH